MDRQSEVYRLSTEADWFGVDLAAAEVFEDGDERPIRTPEEWDAEGWDAGREAPKAREEAKEALLARIADPHAPDDETVAHAYDLEA